MTDYQMVIQWSCSWTDMWNQYINEMSSDGTYGDEIILRVVSNIYNVEIDIVSTLGQQEAQTVQYGQQRDCFRVYGCCARFSLKFWSSVRNELLYCSHEEGNPFDPFVIKVCQKDGTIVSHLPMELARITKFLLDQRF